MYKIHVFDEVFFLRILSSEYCQNTYGHQTFQGGDMLRGARTHKYDLHLSGVVLLGHVTSKKHLHLQKMYWHDNIRCWLSVRGF